VMESLLLRALESTLRHWLKSFSRDQFKLRGRSVQLNDLGMFSSLFFLLKIEKIINLLSMALRMPVGFSS